MAGSNTISLNGYINYHRTLNPMVWTGETLKPELRIQLLRIAHDVFRNLELGDDIKLHDIQLTGSLANFNYTDYSDLDLHLILDFSKIDTNRALVKKTLDAIRLNWNLKHDIVLAGFPVELYFQDITEQHVASGLYSLLHGRWITQPTFSPPTIDQRDVLLKTRCIQSEIDSLESQMGQGNTAPYFKDLLARAKHLKEHIRKMRQSGLTRSGEYSVENLTFKMLRNSKALERLDHLTNQAYDNYMSDTMIHLPEQCLTKERLTTFLRECYNLELK
jgi:hypothetical protein